MDRPGKIREEHYFAAECHLCLWQERRPTYQEASIALTEHLDRRHVGWDGEARRPDGAGTAADTIL